MHCSADNGAAASTQKLAAHSTRPNDIKSSLGPTCRFSTGLGPKRKPPPPTTTVRGQQTSIEALQYARAHGGCALDVTGARMQGCRCGAYELGTCPPPCADSTDDAMSAASLSSSGVQSSPPSSSPSPSASPPPSSSSFPGALNRLVPRSPLRHRPHCHLRHLRRKQRKGDPTCVTNRPRIAGVVCLGPWLSQCICMPVSFPAQSKAS